MSDSTHSDPFPHYVDTRKVFNQKGIFSGDLPKEKFVRLADMLVEGDFHAEATLSFRLDNRNLKLIEGKARATLTVACQRCLRPLDLEVADDIRLALVIDEEAAGRLEGDVEPWIEPEFRLDPVALIEEQLLLAMPLAAYHDKEECKFGLPLTSGSSAQALAGGKSESSVQEVSDGSAKANPFAILKELKTSVAKD